MLSFHVSQFASLYFKFPLIANAFVAVEIDVVVVAGVVVEVGVVVEAVVGIIVVVVVGVDFLGMQLGHWLVGFFCLGGWGGMEL